MSFAQTFNTVRTVSTSGLLALTALIATAAESDSVKQRESKTSKSTSASSDDKSPSKPTVKKPVGAVEGKTKRLDERAGLEFFEARIRPVLVKHCYECHSAESKEAKGGLLLDTREGIRLGGESGHAVVPGSPEDSLIIDALAYETFEMPPDEQLPAEVVADFRKWIATGAADPREAKVASLPTVAGVVNWSAKAAELWSLQPLVRPSVPSVKQVEWPLGDVDRFLLAEMEAHELAPAAEADPYTLARRLYFDLVGLPPTPAEIDAFVAACKAGNREQAYAAEVDKLLASPRFGERWGRHWLDVVRFAESNGRDRDVVYHEAWRYRQYVIDAVNADLPYDRFVTEQLAGDLLPADDDAERDRLVIATGFLALGSKPLSGPKTERQMDIVDEQIDVTTRAVLGLTVACARCHDHKFDPIPTRDYYSLAGIFRSTETLFGPGVIQSNNASKAGQAYNANLQQLSSTTPVDPAANAVEIERRQKLRDEAFAEQRKWLKLIQEADAKKRQPSAEVKANRAKFLKQQREHEAQIEKLKNAEPERMFAMAVRDTAKPEDCPVHVRGDVRTLGPKVPRGFVQVIASSDAPAVDAKQSGRKQLAAWLFDPANPLPARVAANRIWMHLMGEAIVGTPDNFGMQGDRPTHPALLDYLALQFRDGGWSTKRLVREIVLSRAYRESALHAESEEHDPANTWFARRNVRRVDAESLRDAILAAAGNLNVTPPPRSVVAEMAGGEVGRNINEEALAREFNHRSVYLPILRSRVPEFLKVFDFAEPSIVVGRRSTTTVPTQALFFLNSPYVLQQADALAARLLKPSGVVDEHRVETAYLLTLCRRPTAAETRQGLEFLKSFAPLVGEASKSQAEERSLRAWSGFCQALLASAEMRYVN